MTRVKRGTISLKRRKNVLGKAKGYRFGRGSKERLAIEALKHAGKYAFDHRKNKKSERRRLWQTQINGAIRALGSTYSKFIGAMTKKEIIVDRKILAQVANENPETFKRIVSQVMQ